MNKLYELIYRNQKVIDFITNNTYCEYDEDQLYFYRRMYKVDEQELLSNEEVRASLVRYFDEIGQYISIKPVLYVKEFEFKAFMYERVLNRTLTRAFCIKKTREEALIDGLTTLMEEINE